MNGPQEITTLDKEEIKNIYILSNMKLVFCKGVI